MELKDFSLNMIFLANYVQSDDFCFFSSRKRRELFLPFLCLYDEANPVRPEFVEKSKDERVSKYKKVHPSREREMNPKDEIPAHQRHTRADTLARLGLFDIDREHLYLICGEVRTCLDISGCPSF